jgi:hypothetical protein
MTGTAATALGLAGWRRVLTYLARKTPGGADAMSAHRQRGGPPNRRSSHGHKASPLGRAPALDGAHRRDPGYQAFALLRLTFAVAPIAFGLDKFVGAMVESPI